MAWSLLPVNYKDAVWTGYRKYNLIENTDGTISLLDVTVYSQKESSFFGANDANRMNEALNTIMSMVENGTDLYEAFQTYFETQKTLFLNEGNNVIADVRYLTNEEYESYKSYVASLKNEGDTTLDGIESDYEKRMATYESQQKALFDEWFATIKDQLSADVAGSLQNQLNEANATIARLEYMIVHNDFYAPLAVDDAGTLLTDDLGNVIVADWKHIET